MKRILALALLCSASMQITAIDKAAVKLNFTVAKEGDDLAAYKAVLLQIYPQFAQDEAGKEAIKKLCEVRFAVILNWLGKPQHRFVKVQDGQTPVGFLTLEALDKENTRIAIHHSPLLPAYLAKAKEFLVEQVKAQFPQAKTIYSSASGAAPKLKALVKSLGFKEDRTYQPNSELVPDSTGFVGYSQNI